MTNSTAALTIISKTQWKFFNTPFHAGKTDPGFLWCADPLLIGHSAETKMERWFSIIIGQIRKGRLILQRVWMSNIIFNITGLFVSPLRAQRAKLWTAAALKFDSVGHRCITWIRGAVTWTQSLPWGQVTWLNHDLWDWLTASSLSHCPLV